METLFEAFLQQHDSAAWAAVRTRLMPLVHEVDRNATTIWFHFFPLRLADAFAHAANPAQLARELRIDGRCHLADQHDTSHWFLYGHRYWPLVKSAVIKRAESTGSPSSLDLASIVRETANDVAAAAGVDASLTLGVTAVGIMTLRQIGLTRFRSGAGTVAVPPAFARKSPSDILSARKKNDGQGVMGIFRGLKARYTATFDERRDAGRFEVINQQHLTTASANDTRPHVDGPRRCHEGPIPVQCRTASCGTCWVGVLGGGDRLSAVDEHESRRMKEFGYIDTTEARPAIRLACMAVASGNVTIVVPPWNGFVGKAGLGGL